MKITVNSTTLAAELQLLNKIVPTKPALPIFACVCIRAELNTLHFYATDHEIGFSTTCAAIIDEPGAIALPAKRLLDLIEQLPANTDVQISSDATSARLHCLAFKSRLQAFAADDFPRAPELSGTRSTLSTVRLHAMIMQVQYAISDRTKYVVNGALLTITDALMALVATDGKRLSLTTYAQNGGNATRVIVPSGTLKALLALFTDDEIIDFAQTRQHLFFTARDRLLVSRTFDGEFPKYERIIPRTNDKTIIIDRVAFASALRRVGLLSDLNQAVNFTFDANVLLITSSSAEAGDAHEQLVVGYDGPPLKLCVNWQHVLDFLNVASEPTITLAMKDATTPLLLTDGTTFINVIMLMRGAQ